MTKMVYSEEEKRYICFKIYDLMLEGKTLHQIAKEFGLCVHTIHYRIHNWFVGEEYQILCDILNHNFADRLNRANAVRHKNYLKRKGALHND